MRGVGWGGGGDGCGARPPRRPAPKGRDGEGARARPGVSLPLACVTKTMHTAPGSKPLWTPVPSKPRPAQAAPHQLRQTGVNLLETNAVVPNNERTPPRRNCGPPPAAHLEAAARTAHPGERALRCWSQVPVGSVASIGLHKQSHTQGEWSQVPYEPPGAGTPPAPRRLRQTGVNLRATLRI